MLVAQRDDDPPAHPRRGHPRRVVRGGGHRGHQVGRELGDAGAPVDERPARRRAGRVGARLQLGEPGRVGLGAVDPSGEAARDAVGADHVDRARVGDRGDDQVHQVLDPLARPGAGDGAADVGQQLRRADRLAGGARRDAEHAGRGEGHAQLGAAAGRLAQVDGRGELADEREAETESRAVRARLHPAAVVGDDDHELLEAGRRLRLDRPGRAVDVGVHDRVGHELRDRERDVRDDALGRAVGGREVADADPDRCHGRRLGGQRPRRTGRNRWHAAQCTARVISTTPDWWCDQGRIRWLSPNSCQR